jgi:hypothetical protein
MDKRDAGGFAEIAAGARQNLVGEFWQYLRHSRKWWMLPVLVALLCLGLLVVLSATPIAPFIYTLF